MSKDFEIEFLQQIKKYVDGKETALRDYLNSISISGSDTPLIGDIKVIYFSSSSGNDSNDGLNIQRPKKSFEKYAKNNELKNTIILLKSGDQWNLTETIYLKDNCVLTTYGGFQKARLSGLVKSKTSFVKSDIENVYTLQIGSSDLGFVLINNEKNWSRICNEPSDWSNESDDTYYYDRTSKLLYYKSSLDITGQYVYTSKKGHGIAISGGTNTAFRHDILIDNIEFSDFADHGIAAGAYVKNIIITNCYVHDIGGAEIKNNGMYVRYGNGIQFWMHANQNIIITNNVVDRCFDAGITPQVDTASANTYPVGDVEKTFNFIVKHNHITNCFYPIEYFSCDKQNSNQLIFEENFIEHQKDITKGYRGKASKIAGALQIWHTDCIDDNVIFRKNIIIDTENHSLYLPQNKSELNTRIYIKDNIFIMNENNTNHGVFFCTYGELHYQVTPEILDQSQFILANTISPDIEEMSIISYYKSIGNAFIR